MLSLEIHYEPYVYRQIMHWVLRKVKDELRMNEISGFCKVRVDGNIIFVTHAYLCPQVGSSGETDVTGEDLAKLEYETRNVPGDLRLWFHSHPYMDSNWSATDHENMQKLGGPGWFAATVFNDKWETRSAVYQSKPYIHFIDPVSTRIMSNITDEHIKKWDEEFDKNVKVKEYALVEYNDVYSGYPSGYLDKHSNLRESPDFKRTANDHIIYEVLQEEEDKLNLEVEDLEELIFEEENKKGKKSRTLPQLRKQLKTAAKKLDDVQTRLMSFDDSIDNADIPSDYSIHGTGVGGMI